MFNKATLIVFALTTIFNIFAADIVDRSGNRIWAEFNFNETKTDSVIIKSSIRGTLIVIEGEDLLNSNDYSNFPSLLKVGIQENECMDYPWWYGGKPLCLNATNQLEDALEILLNRDEHQSKKVSYFQLRRLSRVLDLPWGTFTLVPE